MIRLPNDLHSLDMLLIKKRNDLRQAKLKLAYFKETSTSELYDKFVAAPAEVDRALGKTPEEIEQTKKEGKKLFKEAFIDSLDKKKKEVHFKELVKDIKKIKDKIQELEIEKGIGQGENKSDTVVKAQNRFEFNY
ncbi:MAG: hypothetical protein PHC46_01745 [Clostridia bacterium]|nr:hypothetical protein [Clostridia bacterium]